MYVEIHNPARQLLVDWTARQLRQRDVLIRRKLIPWHVRKTPEAAALIARIDAAFKRNAHDYWAKGTP